MNDRFRISSLLAGRLAEFNLAHPALLRLAGLPSGFFKQEKLYATTHQLFGLYRAVGELSEDPGIGLKLGTELRFENYHPAAVVAVCSRNFRDALQRMGRYKRLTCPEDIRVGISDSGDEATVEFTFTGTEEIPPDVLTDLCLSWILTVGQKGTNGYIKPLRLELTRSSRHRELLEERFGCKVRFKAKHNALVFRDSDLDRPFVTYNQELLTAIGAHLDAELETTLAVRDIGDEVKRTLKRSLAGSRPTVQSVAADLGMSTRTLQRRLGEISLTFKQLMEEARRELARYYLLKSNVELTGIAFLLGYEDANSFFRAFQTWEGLAPGEWRSKNETSSHSDSEINKMRP
ncbi:MAG: AraC family transcriptional regulator [Verrucomicrobiaceae bacterium]|nr:MAG: AraC family transcriptional regulator [Verrucomicrobiaceae bacterium]